MRAKLEVRSLPPAQRVELLRLADAVPADAAENEPLLIAALDFAKSLAVPWWIGIGAARIYGGTWMVLSGVADVLAALRRVASCTDWGDPYPCRECTACEHRATFPQYHTWEQEEEWELEPCIRAAQYEGEGQ